MPLPLGTLLFWLLVVGGSQKFQFPMIGRAVTIGIGNAGIGNISTLATFFKCCQCDSVASCQFQFPIGAELETTNIGIGNIGTGNIYTLATFVKYCHCDSVASCQFQFPMKEAC